MQASAEVRMPGTGSGSSSPAQPQLPLISRLWPRHLTVPCYQEQGTKRRTEQAVQESSFQTWQTRLLADQNVSCTHPPAPFQRGTSTSPASTAVLGAGSSAQHVPGCGHSAAAEAALLSLWSRDPSLLLLFRTAQVQHAHRDLQPSEITALVASAGKFSADVPDRPPDEAQHPWAVSNKEWF